MSDNNCFFLFVLLIVVSPVFLSCKSKSATDIALEYKLAGDWKLSDKDFTIAAWINASESDITGDILSQYDLSKRKGFHLSLKTNPSPTGIANNRQLSFGIDDNISTRWEDC